MIVNLINFIYIYSYCSVFLNDSEKREQVELESEIVFLKSLDKSSVKFNSSISSSLVSSNLDLEKSKYIIIYYQIII